MRGIGKKYWKILHYAIIKADIKLRDCLSSPKFHVSRLKMHRRQICSHGFSGILSRNTFQNKCKQKTKSSNNTYKGVHFQENHRPRISSIFYNHLFYGAHMNRCFWFLKMSLKIFQYNPMTTVNSIFLSETSLQQFGEFWTLSPFLAP